MDDIAEFIQKVGFPIFISIYLGHFLLNKFDRKFDRLLEEVRRLSIVMSIFVKIYNDNTKADTPTGIPQEVTDPISAEILALPRNDKEE